MVAIHFDGVIGQGLQEGNGLVIGLLQDLLQSADP